MIRQVAARCGGTELWEITGMIRTGLNPAATTPRLWWWWPTRTDGRPGSD